MKKILIVCGLVALAVIGGAIWLAVRGEELQTEVAALRAENSSLRARNRSLSDEIKSLNQKAEESKRSCLLEAETIMGGEHRQAIARERLAIWELQRRLLLPESDWPEPIRAFISYWPTVEAKAPGFVALWKKALPNLKPEAFIVWQGKPEWKKAVPQPGGIYQGVLDAVPLDECAWSPDRTRCVWTCVNDCDPDTFLFYYDKTISYKTMWGYCGTPCHYESPAWIDNETFMYVTSNEDMVYLAPGVSIYKSRPGFQPVGVLFADGPGVDAKELYRLLREP